MTIDKRNLTEEELLAYSDNVWYTARKVLLDTERLISYSEIECCVCHYVPEFAASTQRDRQECLTDILDELINTGYCVRVEFEDYNAYIKTSYFWERWDR